MKNSKIIKTLTVVLIAIMIVSSILPKVASAKWYETTGVWGKGKYEIVIDYIQNVYVYLNNKNQAFCYGDLQPYDDRENVYSICMLKTKDETCAGYFTVTVKNNKIKFKYDGGNDKKFKKIKGTWKYKRLHVL